MHWTGRVPALPPAPPASVLVRRPRDCSFPSTSLVSHVTSRGLAAPPGSALPLMRATCPSVVSPLTLSAKARFQGWPRAEPPGSGSFGDARAPSGAGLALGALRGLWAGPMLRRGRDHESPVPVRSLVCAEPAVSRLRAGTLTAAAEDRKAWSAVDSRGLGKGDMGDGAPPCTLSFRGTSAPPCGPPPRGPPPRSPELFLRVCTRPTLCVCHRPRLLPFPVRRTLPRAGSPRAAGWAAPDLANRWQQVRVPRGRAGCRGEALVNPPRPSLLVPGPQSPRVGLGVSYGRGPPGPLHEVRAVWSLAAGRVWDVKPRLVSGATLGRLGDGLMLCLL